MDNDESDFPIGYKKPPHETRFKPGQSGNPSGRPKKKAISVAEAFVRELNTSVTVTEGGKSKKITKLDAIVKHQTIKAVHGDHKSIAFVIKAVESRANNTKDNLFPVLAAMRAIHASHKTANPKFTRKPASSGANDKLENDGAKRR